MDLYLSVKIRKNEEIDQYDDMMLSKERRELRAEELPGPLLVGYIQSSIEILMRLRSEQEEQGAK
jgi:hypothetical protein